MLVWLGWPVVELRMVSQLISFLHTSFLGKDLNPQHPIANTRPTCLVPSQVLVCKMFITEE